MSDNIAQSHQRGRKMNGQFVRQSRPMRPRRLTFESAAPSQTRRPAAKSCRSGISTASFWQSTNWRFPSPDWSQSAEDTSTSSSPNSLRNPDAGIAEPGLNSRACADVSRCARQPSIWSRSSRCCAPDAACHAHRLWWACLQGDAAELRPLFPLSTLTHFGIAARVLATALAGNQEPLTQRAWRSGLPFLG